MTSNHVLPKPIYTLINTSIEGDPAVVVVNSALRSFKEKKELPWHLHISIACKHLGTNGMPTSEETDALVQLEESIAHSLKEGSNAAFLARVTVSQARILIYRVCNPETANDALQELVSAPSQLREWDYHMQHDPNWTLAKPELGLLEKDKRFN